MSRSTESRVIEMVKYFLSIVVICLVSLPALAKEQTFEATIQPPSGNQVKVRIDARDHHDAEVQMIARYCGGERSCLISGPWVYHGIK